MHDVLSLAWGWKVQAAEAIDMPAAASDERPQVMHPGSFVEMLVEILIGHREGLEVLGFPWSPPQEPREY